MLLKNSALLLGALLASSAVAQFPPKPEDVKTVKSKFHQGIEISYKEVDPTVCETTEGVRSFSGYVHLPPHSINETHERQDYPINTFFWFFESRKDPHKAPLSIWLNGGPGGSSMMGALSENGPCFVNSDSNSTHLNPWSWNNEVNILYIDQPNQVGYSYDVLTNITVNLLADNEGPDAIKLGDFSEGVPDQNATFLIGTSSSQNISATANSTQHAAVAFWHFAQTWFEEFPQYKPHDEKISLFTESYGGRYGPTFVKKFMTQNELIANGSISGPGTHYLRLDTLGLINGCIDAEDAASAYVEFPIANTYGIQGFTEEQYFKAKYEYIRKDGLRDQIRECRRLQLETDPNDYGDVENTNTYCYKAAENLGNLTIAAYVESQKFGWFDITHQGTDPFPSTYLMGYLNQQWVQQALGVPVNFTAVSPAVYEAFTHTGDISKGGLLDDLAYILDNGVKVAMMYGDRDYACNWLGGEQSSLHIPWSNASSFASAGYTPLVLSPFSSGGLVRQFGNLSFTRVYQAGHLVPSYQPQAAYEIFMRSLFNRDVATGEIAVSADYGTEGREDGWTPSDVLPKPENECYVLNPGSCSEEEQGWLKDGTAIVKDWILVGREKGGKRGGHGHGEQGLQTVLAEEGMYEL
ncbi:alpha/beta-hydrolase [Aureobasidium pullulans]|uniref:Carboxypeptidase n=1 Tax=Aureobasidium pullulans TaxID=5580 RepID=A0A4S9XMN8_AURPU|nr:alpha/beta-hydrolase [Aureobasidium pullulans]